MTVKATAQRQDKQRAPMHSTAALRLRARIHALRRRWRDDGVAAIEFALIVPMVAVMFIGAVELSQALTTDRRVTQVANATADLVARSESKISQSEITDIMQAGSYIVAPYNQNPLRITLRNVTSSPSAPKAPSTTHAPRTSRARCSNVKSTRRAASPAWPVSGPCARVPSPSTAASAIAPKPRTTWAPKPR